MKSNSKTASSASDEVLNLTRGVITVPAVVRITNRVLLARCAVVVVVVVVLGVVLGVRLGVVLGVVLGVAVVVFVALPRDS